MSWKPGSLFGIAPMSPPPCTLFWPRSGLQPAAVAADVAGEQREVDQREHVVDGVVVLGDAERPADHARGRRGRRRAPTRGSTSAGTPVIALAALERVRLDRRARTPRSPSSPRSMNVVVAQAGVDDLARHRVGERDVGADVRGRATRRPTARDVVRRGSTDVQPRAVAGSPCSTWWKKIGCASRAFDPHRRIDVRVLDLLV